MSQTSRNGSACWAGDRRAAASPRCPERSRGASGHRPGARSPGHRRPLRPRDRCLPLPDSTPSSPRCGARTGPPAAAAARVGVLRRRRLSRRPGARLNVDTSPRFWRGASSTLPASGRRLFRLGSRPSASAFLVSSAWARGLGLALGPRAPAWPRPSLPSTVRSVWPPLIFWPCFDCTSLHDTATDACTSIVALSVPRARGGLDPSRCCHRP